jgi:hypothetical protein
MPCPTRVLLIRAGSGVHLFLRAWMTRTPKPNDLNRYNYRPVDFVPSPRRRVAACEGCADLVEVPGALRGGRCIGQQLEVLGCDGSEHAGSVADAVGRRAVGDTRAPGQIARLSRG